MKHARNDYDQIQDPSGKIPDNELVFLIRAQDKVGADAVRSWAYLAKAAGADRKIVCLALDHADKMDEYVIVHGSKIPDLPSSAR